MTQDREIDTERLRLYVIGDIHGRLDLLENLIQKIRRDAETCGGESLTVTLGDYIDRGPDSFGVLDCLISKPFPAHYIALKGNHEALLDTTGTCVRCIIPNIEDSADLLDVSGYNACKIIEEQGRFSNIREGRIFPYNGRSVGAAFRRQCRDLKIDDLHFHDLRHEGTSRLFEAGFSIEQVALVTGHKDWKMLRRYTHLKPETLHSQRKANVA
jgi:hypothetical protein